MAKVNYREYIKSEAWAAKRVEFFATEYVASKECFVCKTPRRRGFHVHHMTYKRLGRERMADLVIVCPDCHDAIHEFHNEWKPIMEKKGKEAVLWNMSHKVRNALREKIKPKEPEFPIKLTNKQIDAGRSEKGGFTAKTLRSWGVPWPPPAGWRKCLLSGIPVPGWKAAPEKRKRSKKLRSVLEPIIEKRLAQRSA